MNGLAMQASVGKLAAEREALQEEKVRRDARVVALAARKAELASAVDSAAGPAALQADWASAYARWDVWQEEQQTAESEEQHATALASQDVQLERFRRMTGCNGDKSKERAVYELPTAEKMATMRQFKEDGSLLYGEGQYYRAAGMYRRVAIYYDYTFPDTPEQQNEADELRLAALVNLAACKAQTGEWDQVVEICTSALADPQLGQVVAGLRKGEAAAAAAAAAAETATEATGAGSGSSGGRSVAQKLAAKALYRRAHAWCMLDKYDKAEAGLLDAWQLVPGSSEVRRLHELLRDRKAGYRLSSKDASRAMFSSKTSTADGGATNGGASDTEKVIRRQQAVVDDDDDDRVRATVSTTSSTSTARSKKEEVNDGSSIQATDARAGSVQVQEGVGSTARFVAPPISSPPSASSNNKLAVLALIFVVMAVLAGSCTRYALFFVGNLTRRTGRREL